MDAPIDFANSYLTFALTAVNTARINIDAACSWCPTGGATELFVLICACQGENMYVPEKLILAPPYNFSGVFSATESHLIRDAADASIERDTVSNHAGRFDRVTIDLARFNDGRELLRDHEICAATLANQPLIARTELVVDGGSWLLEYPVTTMNVRPEDSRWQVDTGPLLIPAASGSDKRILDLRPGFIVYNRRDYVEWTARQKVPLPGGGLTHHYVGSQAAAAVNRLYSGWPA